MRTWARSLKRIGLASTVAVAGALALPSAVLAAPATVSLQGGAFTVRAAPATEDVMTIRTAADALVVSAPASKVVGVPPCSPGQVNVLCPGANTLQSILVELGDQDDSLVVASISPVPSILRAGRGDDRVTGGAGPERISGGRGADSVRGGAGDDTLDMRDGSRDVRIDCGPGQDTAIIDRDKDPKPKGCEKTQRR